MPVLKTFWAEDLSSRVHGGPCFILAVWHWDFDHHIIYIPCYFTHQEASQSNLTAAEMWHKSGGILTLGRLRACHDQSLCGPESRFVSIFVTCGSVTYKDSQIT